MKRAVAILFLYIISCAFSNAQDLRTVEQPIKETYKLQGTIEYDDNPVDVIYLDENIDRPQVNIPKRSLTLPVGVLNITSNTGSTRSALARAAVNRGRLNDILPLSGSISEQMGGFSYGQNWGQEMSPLAQMESTTEFFVRYDTPKYFSMTTAVRQATNADVGTQYNTFRLVPEWHITDRLTLRDTFANYMQQTRYKNEIAIIYTPSLKKYADALKFQLGFAETYYQGGRQRRSVEFSTGFKL